MGTALTARRIMDTDMAAGTMGMDISMGANSAGIKETAAFECRIGGAFHELMRMAV